VSSPSSSPSSFDLTTTSGIEPTGMSRICTVTDSNGLSDTVKLKVLFQLQTG
jgi:hypothetical protein